MPGKSQSILLAGVAGGVGALIAGLLPTVGDCIGCVLFIAAGVLAVWHYTDRHQVTIKGGQGLVLGALAGLVAGIAQSILDQILTAVGAKPGWREELRLGFEQSNMDPAQMEQIMEWFSSPLALIAIMLVVLVMCMIAGGIGGVIGANIFKRGSDASSTSPVVDR